MKILLSVYACEPHKGSEPGIGWNWVINLQNLGHDLTVLTRLNNKEIIDKEIQSNINLKDIHFIYYDLPKFLVKNKKKIGVHLYYEFWQIGLYRFVKNNINTDSFDIIHHLTFGVFRHPSYLYKFNIPFIMGPLGGGEMAPLELMDSFPIRYRFLERLRNLINSLSILRYSLIQCFKSSLQIYTRTNDTLDNLPIFAQNKAKVFIDVGTYEKNIALNEKELIPNSTIHVLFVGRLIYWKGLSLAVEAFAKFHTKFPNSKFSIVGDGSYKVDLQNQIRKLGLENVIFLKGSVPHEEIEREYLKANIFLFPSIHDAGPLVIFEALRYGLPVVALNLGGVGQFLGPNYPTLTTLSSYDFLSCTKSMTESLLKLSYDPSFYFFSSNKSLEIARNNSWENTVKNVYNDVAENLFKI